MELRVSSQVAAASLDGLLDQVSSGTATEVIIERDGKAVGRLVPALQAGRALTREDIDSITHSIGQLDDGWAEAAEEAVKLGNTPMPAEPPWDR
jgi:antitoxin (DNA-binding transcriptional repressor) of toxin-antitoxin stability system